ncbi:MAG: TolC family protein [Acidobacteriota bacterium]
MWRALPAVLLLVGCATAVDLPEIDPSAGIPPVWSESFEAPGESITSLAGLSGDPRLRQLVRAALEGNPDIARTALRLRESGALLAVSQGRRLPGVELDAGQRQDRSAEQASSTSTTTVGLTLDWEIDVWGRLADQVREAERRHSALAADQRAARSSLAARTLQAALEQILRSRRLEIETRRAASLEQTLEIIRERYRLGLGSVTDWDAAQSELARSRAQGREDAEAVARSRRRLGLLLGDLAAAPPALPNSLPTVWRPLVPMPGETLAQRPDVAASLDRLAAAGLAEEVARKALLPGFRLTGSLTAEGTSLDSLLEDDPAWTLLANLAAPLINRKALLAEHEAAQYRRAQAAYSHRIVLLDAVLEIENGLGTERSLLEQLPALELSQHHAELSLTSFEGQYTRGLADILDLLAAQRAAFDSQLRLIEARTALLQNRIDLGLALGLEAI